MIFAEGLKGLDLNLRSGLVTGKNGDRGPPQLRARFLKRPAFKQTEPL